LDWDVGVETGQQCRTTVAKPNLNLFKIVQKFVPKNGFGKRSRFPILQEAIQLLVWEWRGPPNWKNGELSTADHNLVNQRTPPVNQHPVGS
jgi:hypothetical protein